MITLDYFYRLLGDVVLLPIPLGKKGPPYSWQQLTFDQHKEREAGLLEAISRGGNIGVLLGPKSNRLFALDLDDDRVINPWLRRHPWLANTLRTRGKRGCQFLMRLEPECEYPNGKAVFKLTEEGKVIGELRMGGSGGAQSVIFGVHPEGMRYQIVVGKPPLVISGADLDVLAPGVIFHGAEEESAHPPTNGNAPIPSNIWNRVTSYLESCDPAISGQHGHDTTFRVLCTVSNGFALSREETLAAARHYNQKCEPTWTDKDLEHKVDDALKAKHEKPRGHLLDGEIIPGSPLSKRLKDERPQAEQVETRPGADGQGDRDQEEPLPSWDDSLKLAACTSEDLRSLEIEPREPILSDFFKTGDLGFIYAARGVGKSWLGLYIARGIASGEDVGPWQVRQVLPVAYFDGEMPVDDIRNRDAALGKPCPQLTFINHELLFRRTSRTLNLANLETQRAITKFCVDGCCDVLMLDNLSTLASGLDENAGSDWEILQSWLLDLRRRGISVIFIHHAGRNREMRGHSKREDPAFWIIALDSVDSIETVPGTKFVARFVKNRNATALPSPIEFYFQPSGDGVLVTFKEADLLHVFRKHVSEGLTKASDIAAEMHISTGYTSKLASKAKAQGWLEVQGREYCLKTGNEEG
jgi:hypothetical protein